MSFSCVNKIEFQIDMVKLSKLVEETIEKYPLNESTRQICFTSNKSFDQSVYDGVGSLYEYSESQWKAQEKDFVYFLNEFKGTYYEEIYNGLQLWTHQKIARMRLMYLPPRCCYSLHADKTKRLHVAVITNENAFLLFKEEPPIHIPKDGYVYEVDTRQWHTALNCGDESRIHLVFSLRNDVSDDIAFEEKYPKLKIC
jgi:hypothetical protein